MAAVAMTEMTEARLARLESDVAHIRSDVADLKTDIRDIRKDWSGSRDETYKEFTSVRAGVGTLRDEMHREFGAVRDEMHREFGAVRDEMHREFSAVRKEMGALRGEMHEALGDLSKAITHGDLVTRIWMLLLCGAMLGVMARGFHWI